MKKIWIAVIIIIIFILADIGVRIFWADDLADSDSVDNKVVENPSVYKETKSKKKDDSKKDKKKENQSKSFSFKTDSGLRTCKEAKAYLFKNGVDAITDVEIRRVWWFQDEVDSSKMLTESVDAYLTCKGVSERDFSRCEKDETIMGEESECRISFKFLVPYIARFVGQLDIEKFQVEALKYPEDIRAYMVNFFKLISTNDPDACLSLGEGESDIGRFVCSVANNRIISDNGMDATKSKYWGLKAIKKRDAKLLSNIKKDLPMKRIVEAALGDKKACDNLLTELLAQTCKE